VLSGRRVWADLEHAPDGICADADGAVWVATVPGQCCVHVREGGEVLNTVTFDRGCFACMLGGEDGRTLFVGAAVWHGMEELMAKGAGVDRAIVRRTGAARASRRSPVSSVLAASSHSGPDATLRVLAG
jgi:sugar lactone lactonase YvrE